MSELKELRVVTYMCPTHPVQLYELILELLENALNCYATLQYESRSSGPFPNRPDPFSTNKVDLGEYSILFIYLNQNYLLFNNLFVLVESYKKYLAGYRRDNVNVRLNTY